MVSVGFVSGTFKGLKDKWNSNYFRIPAAWKAAVVNGKVKHWQIYRETKSVEQIIENETERNS